LAELDVCPQIIIGLIAPIGTNTTKVMTNLKQALVTFDYQVQEIKISEIITEALVTGREISKDELSGLSTYERKRLLIKKGDSLRKEADDASICAALAVMSIQHVRGDYKQRKAFVLNSIKNTAEIELLRKTYGTRFLAIGLVSPYRERSEYLRGKIKADLSASASGHEDVDRMVDELIQADKHDANNKLGQQVANCLPMADAYVAPDRHEEFERLIEIWHDNPFITPTRGEQAMYFAYTAGLKSIDYSRQVGAAVVNKEGDVLVTGCNDVPRPGGGYFWHGDTPDFRDHVNGYDENQARKERLLKELVHIFPDEFISEGNKSSLVLELLRGRLRAKYKHVRLANLIEFGRMVHAEMAAITTGARLGISLNGQTLYCTTFPCHMCSKLIISAGIKEVVYIEPYDKSLSLELFEGLINHLDEESPEEFPDFSPVIFRTYKGVSPRRYEGFFNFKNNRKMEDGRRKEWKPAESSPVTDFIVDYIEKQETAVLTRLQKLSMLGAPKPSEGA
jgi:cytidine deaminase